MDVIDGKWIAARLGSGRGAKVALADALGVKPDVVSKILGGTRRVQPEEIPKVLAHFGGDGSANLVQRGPHDVQTVDQHLTVAGPDATVVMVPVLDIAASAGPGTYVDYEVQIAQMSLPRDYLRSLTSTSPGQLAIISVKGDSMEPTLRDGDIVLVDGAKTSHSFDGLFVLEIDGTLHVKRLARSGKQGTVRVLSDNQLYPPVEYGAEDVRVIGKVRWRGGPMG